MNKLLWFIDSLTHKISDPWCNNEWPGWQVVMRLQYWACDRLVKWDD